MRDVGWDDWVGWAGVARFLSDSSAEPDVLCDLALSCLPWVELAGVGVDGAGGWAGQGVERLGGVGEQGGGGGGRGA